MQILKFKVTFNDIYEWGGGWNSLKKANAWHDFWENVESNFWNVIEKDSALYIVSVGGGCLIHPMNFSLVMQTFGRSFNKGVECFPAIDELKRLCEQAAEQCGGTAIFSPVIQIAA